MKKLIATGALLALLTSGCGLTGVKNGERTTLYNQDGTVASVTDQTAIGDPNTEYYGAVKAVADQSARNIKSRADAIKDATTPKTTDSADAQAWKSAFAALAIATMDDRTAANIASVHKATTGYDVASSAVGAVKDIATVGLPVYGAVRAVKYLAQGMGDKTEVSMEGDGNSFESSKTHINNEVHSSVSGDESNPTVTGTPSGTTDSPATSETINEATAATPTITEP